jgi:hypothetical protein
MRAAMKSLGCWFEVIFTMLASGAYAMTILVGVGFAFVLAAPPSCLLKATDTYRDDGGSKFIGPDGGQEWCDRQCKPIYWPQLCDEHCLYGIWHDDAGPCGRPCDDFVDGGCVCWPSFYRRCMEVHGPWDPEECWPYRWEERCP